MLTVKDILHRPMFRSARVVNKNADLERHVRWVHVLEITEFETLLRGSEMILSTGVALDNQGTDYVRKLISNDVACLCIELGAHFPSVPKEMIDLADAHQFPLIVFTSIVRFVDITQEIHAEIINAEHLQLSELDRLSNDFHHLTLHAHGNMKILKKLQTAIHKEIIFLPTDGKAHFLPAIDKNEQIRIEDAVMHEIGGKNVWEERWFDKKRQKSFLLKPIEAMDQHWGVLLTRNCEPLTIFASQALDRAIGALAQNILRDFYTEEKKLLQEHSWVQDLIDQNIQTEKEAHAKLRKGISNDIDYRICLIEVTEPFDKLADQRALQYQTLRRIRYAFQKQGLDSFIAMNQNHSFIVLAVKKPAINQDKQRTLKAIQFIEENPKPFRLRIAVSQAYAKLLEAHVAFREAEDVLKLGTIQSNFYEDIGIYQLLLKLDDRTVERYTRTYLYPLLNYDDQKKSTLLQTLRVYLQLNCSKQQVAQELQIARQTLYKRLNKIDKLLGQDITTDPHMRMTVEVAIAAYDLQKDRPFSHIDHTMDDIVQ